MSHATTSPLFNNNCNNPAPPALHWLWPFFALGVRLLSAGHHGWCQALKSCSQPILSAGPPPSSLTPRAACDLLDCDSLANPRAKCSFQRVIQPEWREMRCPACPALGWLSETDRPARGASYDRRPIRKRSYTGRTPSPAVLRSKAMTLTRGWNPSPSSSRCLPSPPPLQHYRRTPTQLWRSPSPGRRAGNR